MSRQLLSTAGAETRRLAIFELNCCFRIGIIRENNHRRTTVFAMKQTDARITELMTRLTALERERADVVAEINTLRSMRSEETEPIRVVPSGNAGDPTDGIRQSRRSLPCFAGFSAAAQMSTLSVGRTVPRGGAATHPPARMNGAAGFAKNRKSNVQHVQVRHSCP